MSSPSRLYLLTLFYTLMCCVDYVRWWFFFPVDLMNLYLDLFLSGDDTKHSWCEVAKFLFPNKGFVLSQHCTRLVVNKSLLHRSCYTPCLSINLKLSPWVAKAASSPGVFKWPINEKEKEGKKDLWERKSKM